jgi:hypothetical protein
MKFKLLPILLFFSISGSSFSQNIFIDSNQVAFFLNGNSLWSDVSHSLGVSGGFSFGGILDFGYHGSFVTIEGEEYYGKDYEYNSHSFIVNGILTKKKMQVSVDLAITVSSTSISTLVLGFSLAKKIQIETSVEAVFNLSTGLGFNLDNFSGKQEAALALSADFLMNEIFYFGPGIGYSDKEFFYGFDVGIVIPFSHNTKNQ